MFVAVNFISTSGPKTDNPLTVVPCRRFPTMQGVSKTTNLPEVSHMIEAHSAVSTKKVFQKFHQLRRRSVSKNKRSKGTGLGFAAVSRLSSIMEEIPGRSRCWVREALSSFEYLVDSCSAGGVSLHPCRLPLPA